MAYCTKTEVRAQFPLLDVAAVSEDNLDDFIARSDSEIDAVLSANQYYTPVSDADLANALVITQLSILMSAHKSALATIGAGQNVDPIGIDGVMDDITDLKMRITKGQLPITRISFAAEVTYESYTDPVSSQFETIAPLINPDD